MYWSYSDKAAVIVAKWVLSHFDGKLCLNRMFIHEFVDFIRFE